MRKRYAIKNFFFSFLFFSVLELFCFFSALSSKNFVQIPEFGDTPQSSPQASLAMFYNLLYFFILAFVSQFLSDKYNPHLFRNIWESFKRLILWGLPVRLLINFLYFFLSRIPFQYYSLKHELEFLTEICFNVFICIIALYVPMKKQKSTFNLKQITQGKKHIFLVLTAGILLLITLRSITYNSIFSYYNVQISKYVSPDISYLHGNMEYQSKLINLLSLTAVDVLIFLCIFYIVNQHYCSYQDIIAPKRSRFFGMVMMVFLYNGVSSAIVTLIVLSAIISPITMPYQYHFGASGITLQPNGFIYSESPYIIQKDGTESVQTILSLAHIQIGYQTTKSVTKKVDGFDFLTDEADKRVLKSFWIQSDSDSISISDSKASLMKLNVSGFTAYRFGTNAFAYMDENGNPQVLAVEELNHQKYDKNLTATIEAAVSEGYFDFLEYSSEYLTKYDYAFLAPTLKRYAGNQLNSAEKECNKQINTNYMIEFAKHTLV